jgi:AAA+ ATPase superfamily predicted ATPase
LNVTRESYSSKRETESRFDRIMDELKRGREARDKKWEAQEKKWETERREQNKKWEENQRELIKELINFFVAMTKESHLCHVLLSSSDGYFIEKIYNDSKLQTSLSD